MSSTLLLGHLSFSIRKLGVGCCVSACVATKGDPDARTWGPEVYLGGDLREELREVEQEGEKSHQRGQLGLETTGHLIRGGRVHPSADPPDVKEAGVGVV